MVLILGTRHNDVDDNRDSSRFTAEQARSYLQQIMVPLFVWRFGDVNREAAWGGAQVIQRQGDFRSALNSVRQNLLSQRILWIDGTLNPASINPPLPSGIALAGRSR